MTGSWDRTEEFFQHVQLYTPQNRFPASSSSSAATGAPGSFRARQLPTELSRYGSSEGSSECPVGITDLGEKTHFSKDAASIGVDLGHASRKLEELQKFAKHRGIFEDRSAEIQALTYDLRQMIIGLNHRIDELERAVQTSSESLHDQVHHRSVVQTLRTKLGEVTRSLKTILEQRATAMKRQEDRRGLYSHNVALAHQFHGAEQSSADVNADLETGRLIQNFHTQTFAPRESAYHTSRVEAVETIQRMIGELAQIFHRVATLVVAQEELTVRIEDDMSSALYNIQQGETHLLKYLRSISSNRSLILKVFAVLIVFIIFFIVFLA